MKSTRQFYVPNVAMWNWRLVSPAFVRIHLDRARRSYAETDQALQLVEATIEEIHATMRKEWGTASANRMRQLARKIAEQSPEIRRIHYVRKLLRERMDLMEANLERTRSV